MTDERPRQSPAETEARLLRIVEETRKFVSEQHKLDAEQRKLDAEQHKLDAGARKLAAEALKFSRERWLAPVVALAAAVGTLSGILVTFLRLGGRGT